ncbi:MAG: hypothetical protein JW866_06160 [Ignavibacteriales bacterium]|nr:hypothetical protein [Ignavibacteriales bacterium]
MKVIKILLTLYFLFTAFIIAQQNGDWRTRKNGNWTGTDVWEVYLTEFNDWIPINASPPSGISSNIRIRHNINFNINGYYYDIIIASSRVLTIVSGFTLENRLNVTVNGSLINNGTIINKGSITGAGIKENRSTGVYEHALNGGTIPSMLWYEGSILNITGITTTAPTVNTQTDLYNVNWNCSGQTDSLTFPTNLNPNYGLTIQDDGSGSINIPSISFYCAVIQQSGTTVNLIDNITILSINEDFYYQNYGKLICNEYVISGSGGFSQIGGELHIGSPLGINGNIQCTLLPYFGNVTYVYTHAGDQVTGTNLPTDTIVSLQKTGSGVLTLINTNATISDSLVMSGSNSRLRVGDGQFLVLNSGASITGSGTQFIELDGTGYVRKYFSGDQTYSFPMGTIGEYSPASLTVSSISGSAYLDIYCDDVAYSNPGWTNYIDRHWRILRDGTITYEGSLTYLNGDVVGEKKGILFGRYTSDWEPVGGSIDTLTNILSISSTSSGNYYYSGIEGGVESFYFRTKNNGDWTDYTNVWEMSSDGVNWVAATRYPTYLDSTITIDDSVYVNINVTIDQTSNGGYLIVNSGTTLTVNDGVGDDLYNIGYIVNSGTIVKNGTIVNGSDFGSYVHARDGGEVPAMTWPGGQFSGKLYITGIINNAPIVNAQINLVSVVWNCSGQTNSVVLDTDLNPTNTLTIENTGSEFEFLYLPGMTFNGNVNQCTNAKVELAGNITILVDKSYSNSGLLSLSNKTISGDGIFSPNPFSSYISEHDQGIFGGNILLTVDQTSSGSLNYYFWAAGDQFTGRMIYPADTLYKAGGGLLTLSTPFIINYKLELNDFSTLRIPSGLHLIFKEWAIITGASSINFIELADATSYVKKIIGGVGTYEFPIGTIGEYSPVSYTQLPTVIPEPMVSIYCDDEAYGNPGWSTNYLQRYWNINGSDYSAVLTYLEADIVGDENSITFGRYYDNWQYTGGSIDAGTNTITVNSTKGSYFYSGIPAGGIKLNLKVYLQGAYR